MKEKSWRESMKEKSWRESMKEKSWRESMKEESGIENTILDTEEVNEEEWYKIEDFVEKSIRKALSPYRRDLRRTLGYDKKDFKDMIEDITIKVMDEYSKEPDYSDVYDMDYEDIVSEYVNSECY